MDELKPLFNATIEPPVSEKVVTEPYPEEEVPVDKETMTTCCSDPPPPPPTPSRGHPVVFHHDTLTDALPTIILGISAAFVLGAVVTAMLSSRSVPVPAE